MHRRNTFQGLTSRNSWQNAQIIRELAPNSNEWLKWRTNSMVQRFWITSIPNHSFPPSLSTFSLAGLSFLEYEPWRTRKLVFNLARCLLLSDNQFLSSRASLNRESIISAPVSLACDLKPCLGFSTWPSVSTWLCMSNRPVASLWLIDWGDWCDIIAASWKSP